MAIFAIIDSAVQTIKKKKINLEDNNLFAYVARNPNKI